MTDVRIVLALCLAGTLALAGCSANASSAARFPAPLPRPVPGAEPPPAPADGERFALLQGVRMADGRVAVVADVVRILHGDEASAAAAARDPLFAGAKGDLVVNDERETVTLPMSPAARIRYLSAEVPALTEAAPAAFLERWLAADNADPIRRYPYRLVLVDGAVTTLEQQYVR